MRNARNSRSSWAPDLSILSGIFTRIRKGSTPGGLTGSQREQRTRDGGSTISAFPSLKDRLVGAKIHTEIMGSDHCPVELDID